MAKVRIHSWAKDNGKSSIEVVKKLNASGHNVRNQTMPVEESVLNSLYKNDAPKSAAKPAAKPAASETTKSTDTSKPTTETEKRPNTNTGERRPYPANNNNG